jgi:hypothetical protein
MMAITANTCRVCSERFLFGRGQGYAHDLCSLDCERDELKAKAQSLQRRCEAAESILERLVAWDECFPKGTIHAYRAEEKHDGIVNDARKLLAPTE